MPPARGARPAFSGNHGFCRVFGCYNAETRKIKLLFGAFDAGHARIDPIAHFFFGATP
jgi:hypothetical protein